jgi:hypothetical protein
MRKYTVAYGMKGVTFSSEFVALLNFVNITKTANDKMCHVIPHTEETRIAQLRVT